MSHWNGYEIRDIFEDEDCSIEQFLPFRDYHSLESITFNESHKKPQHEAVEIKKSTYCEARENQALVPKNDERIPPSLNEESSNILEIQLPLLSEKIAPELDLIKYYSANLACHETNISPTGKEVLGSGTENIPLYSDYPLLRLSHVALHKKLGHLSSANAIDGVLAKDQRDSEDNLQFYDGSNNEDVVDFDRSSRNIDSTFAQGNTAVDDEISWLSSSSHEYHDMGDALQTVVLSSVSELSNFNHTSSAHGWLAKFFHVTKPLDSNTGIPFGTGCSSFQIYSDNERKGKSVLSELAYDQSGSAENYSTCGPNGYGVTCKDPNLTAADQGFLSSVMSAPLPCSLQTTSKQTLFLESYASCCLHSSNNTSRYAAESMGVLPAPLAMPSTPIETNNKRCASHKFFAGLSIENPLEQHAKGGDTSPQGKYKLEDEVEVKKGIHKNPNLSTSNISTSTLKENSCMTNDLSLKAVNFQQLQMIIDQLGIRAKLCIRDSLYRLARSAEQSHYYGDVNNDSRGSSPTTRPKYPKDSKRPTEYIGMPINTNAIERAIAYLLFHKSLESFSGTSDESMWLRSPIHINHPVDTRIEPHPPST